MELIIEAQALFAQHYNCAQSTFIPFARQMGLDDESALRVAAAFGGGMGRNGQNCGAVSGALLAIGLAKGSFCLHRWYEDNY